MLRITKQSDYGILLMTLIATRPESGSHSARDLADETGLPLPMVGKILKLLVRDGLLVSQRGAKGGYRLSKSPAGITVEDIVRSLEGPIAITECSETGPGGCRFTGACTLQPNWMRINRALRKALQGITLMDMMPADGKLDGVSCAGMTRAAEALERMAGAGA